MLSRCRIHVNLQNIALYYCIRNVIEMQTNRQSIKGMDLLNFIWPIPQLLSIESIHSH